MNGTLFRYGIQSNAKILLIFMLVFCLYISVIVSMFDPELGKALDEMAKTMPDLMAMFGMSSAGTTLIGFLSTYLYGFIMLVFPLIFTIIITNNLVARHTDKGSMAYLLASPHTRNQVIFTQMLVFGVLLFLLIIFGTALGVLVSEIMFPGELDVGTFIRLNVDVLCLHFAIGGICFFASCISNETRVSLFIGGGITGISYLIQMLANMGGKLENLKYATFFTLFDADGIIARESSANVMIGILVIAGLALYGASMYAFNKRDLPI